MIHFSSFFFGVLLALLILTVSGIIVALESQGRKVGKLTQNMDALIQVLGRRGILQVPGPASPPPQPDKNKTKKSEVTK